MLEVILKLFEQPDEIRTHDAARSKRRISKMSRGRRAEKNRSLRKNYRSQYSSKGKRTPPLFV